MVVDGHTVNVWDNDLVDPAVYLICLEPWIGVLPLPSVSTTLTVDVPPAPTVHPVRPDSKPKFWTSLQDAVALNADDIVSRSLGLG